MGHSSEEKIIANETTTSADCRTENCNIPMNPMIPAQPQEGLGLVASSSLFVCTTSIWPASSTVSSLDTTNMYSLGRAEMSSTNTTPSLTSPYLINDSRFMVEELTVGNFRNFDASVIGCSSTTEETNHKGRCSYQLAGKGQKNEISDGDLISDHKDSSELTSRGDLKRKPTDFQDSEHLSGNQNNMDSSVISTHLIGSNNIISSNRLLEGSRSKTLYSSSFSKYFLGQSLKATKKDILNKYHGVSAEIDQNKNVQGYSSEETSDDLTNKNSVCSQLHLQDVVREGSELPNCGINLREWLDSKGSNVSKNQKLLLFRRIVQIVDVAHGRAKAFLDLRPSSFILLETGDVEYIGPLLDVELFSANMDTTKKRRLEWENSGRDNFCVNIQNVGEDKLTRPEARFISDFVDGHIRTHIIDTQNYSSKYKALNLSTYEGSSTGNCSLKSHSAQLEKKWYDHPKGLNLKDLLSFNIYCLGLLLFELLCHFESNEAHSAAMLDLHHRILPPSFLSESPKEAGFCFWLLHPEPSSRPTTREILQSELIHESENLSLTNYEPSCPDMVDDAESDLLLHFLLALKKQKQNKASNLLASLDVLDLDIKEVERRHSQDHRSMGIPYNSISRTNLIRDKLLENIGELENAYFCLRSHIPPAEIPDTDRLDKDVLRNRERLSWIQTQHNWPTTEEKPIDRVGTFFDGICKFARYNKFKVCGTLRNNDILNSNNVICSLSFDREEEYIAAAGVSKKIKIFELDSLLDDSVDVHYPVLEMSNKSKFSCICWNKYIKNYLASTNYDGLVQIWDASTGQEFAQYKEHQKRAWSIDFSQVDPTKFASGGDDCSVKLWNINERNSTGTIWNQANVCCVQFSAFSSHLLAFGSADYRIYCYDLRHTKIPWCTLVGHKKAVSYVRFLDSEALVSASTDNKLKLWDLKKTSLEGLSQNACSLTFSGHSNEKNFVGLAVLDGYIACGSETNEAYAYYRSLPMPITSYKFECLDPISGHEIGDGNGQFVSSVCWRRKSEMLVAANSSGSIKILRMV
ncbi:UNVERIFIED_CONTAM: protein suppressor of phya 1 [Sesamum latifolium]|uniref:Protein suppressor of phya 1 n=1 Tax=Sesamum latifolium TaxID=2727402 RepID=A0AAW2U514_9LAMI